MLTIFFIFRLSPFILVVRNMRIDLHLSFAFSAEMPDTKVLAKSNLLDSPYEFSAYLNGNLLMRNFLVRLLYLNVRGMRGSFNLSDDLYR